MCSLSRNKGVPLNIFWLYTKFDVNSCLSSQDTAKKVESEKKSIIVTIDQSPDLRIIAFFLIIEISFV